MLLGRRGPAFQVSILGFLSHRSINQSVNSKATNLSVKSKVNQALADALFYSQVSSLTHDMKKHIIELEFELRNSKRENDDVSKITMDK